VLFDINYYMIENHFSTSTGAGNDNCVRTTRAYPGETLTPVAITGTNFAGATAVNFGEGIRLINFTIHKLWPVCFVR